MGNQTDTKALSANQAVDTRDFDLSRTSVGFEKTSQKQQSAQPRESPPIDTRYYNSKEIKVEKILIK